MSRRPWFSWELVLAWFLIFVACVVAILQFVGANP